MAIREQHPEVYSRPIDHQYKYEQHSVEIIASTGDAIADGELTNTVELEFGEILQGEIVGVTLYQTFSGSQGEIVPEAGHMLLSVDDNLAEEGDTALTVATGLFGVVQFAAEDVTADSADARAQVVTCSVPVPGLSSMYVTLYHDSGMDDIDYNASADAVSTLTATFLVKKIA